MGMKILIIMLEVSALAGCVRSEVPVQCMGYATFVPVPNLKKEEPQTASIKLDRLRQNANGSWDFHRINGEGMTSQSAWMKPAEYERIECTSGPKEQLSSLRTRKGKPPEFIESK